MTRCIPSLILGVFLVLRFLLGCAGLTAGCEEGFPQYAQLQGTTGLTEALGGVGEDGFFRFPSLTGAVNFTIFDTPLPLQYVTVHENSYVDFGAGIHLRIGANSKYSIPRVYAGIIEVQGTKALRYRYEGQCYGRGQKIANVTVAWEVTLIPPRWITLAVGPHDCTSMLYLDPKDTQWSHWRDELWSLIQTNPSVPRGAGSTGFDDEKDDASQLAGKFAALVPRCEFCSIAMCGGAGGQEWAVSVEPRTAPAPPSPAVCEGTLPRFTPLKGRNGLKKATLSTEGDTKYWKLADAGVQLNLNYLGDTYNEAQLYFSPYAYMTLGSMVLDTPVVAGARPRTPAWLFGTAVLGNNTQLWLGGESLNGERGIRLRFEDLEENGDLNVLEVTLLPGQRATFAVGNWRFTGRDSPDFAHAMKDGWGSVVTWMPNCANCEVAMCGDREGRAWSVVERHQMDESDCVAGLPTFKEAGLLGSAALSEVHEEQPLPMSKTFSFRYLNETYDHVPDTGEMQFNWGRELPGKLLFQDSNSNRAGWSMGTNDGLVSKVFAGFEKDTEGQEALRLRWTGLHWTPSRLDLATSILPQHPSVEFEIKLLSKQRAVISIGSHLGAYRVYLASTWQLDNAIYSDSAIHRRDLPLPRCEHCVVALCSDASGTNWLAKRIYQDGSTTPVLTKGVEVSAAVVLSRPKSLTATAQLLFRHGFANFAQLPFEAVSVSELTMVAAGSGGRRRLFAANDQWLRVDLRMLVTSEDVAKKVRERLSAADAPKMLQQAMAKQGLDTGIERIIVQWGHKEEGLSTGAIAGIAVGAGVGVLALVALLICLCRRRTSGMKKFNDPDQLPQPVKVPCLPGGKPSRFQSFKEFNGGASTHKSRSFRRSTSIDQSSSIKSPIIINCESSATPAPSPLIPTAANRIGSWPTEQLPVSTGATDGYQPPTVAMVTYGSGSGKLEPYQVKSNPLLDSPFSPVKRADSKLQPQKEEFDLLDLDTPPAQRTAAVRRMDSPVSLSSPTRPGAFASSGSSMTMAGRVAPSPPMAPQPVDSMDLSSAAFMLPPPPMAQANWPMPAAAAAATGTSGRATTRTPAPAGVPLTTNPTAQETPSVLHLSDSDDEMSGSFLAPRPGPPLAGTPGAGAGSWDVPRSTPPPKQPANHQKQHPLL